MPLEILFDNLNNQRFPKVPPGMVNPGIPPSRITRLFEMAGQLWRCNGSGSATQFTPDRKGRAYLEWYYLDKIVPLSEWDGNTFQSDGWPEQNMKGSAFMIDRQVFVFTGIKAQLFTSYIPPEFEGNVGVDPDFGWLYGVPAEAKVWCPSCAQLPPFSGQCEHNWSCGIMMGRIDGHEDGAHYPFERQEDGFTWVLPGTPPYPDIPELVPMPEPREQRPDVVDGLQLSMF